MSKVADSEQENSVLSPPSGFKLHHTLEGHSDVITQIAWSADGKKLASASKDHTIRLWNTETGELVSILEGHADIVLGIAWSPDGRAIASAAKDDIIKIWNTKTGKLGLQIEGENCGSISWSPSGKTFASAGRYYSSQKVKLWNAKTGKQRNIYRAISESIQMAEKSISINIKSFGSATYINSSIFAAEYDVISSFRGIQSFREILNSENISNLVRSASGETLALAQGQDSIKLYDANECI